MRYILLFVWLACSVGSVLPASASEKLTQHTWKLAPGEKSPPATLTDMKWLVGHWAGEAFGGLGEEMWSPAQAGSMMGMYRLIKDGKPVLYEFLNIVEEHGSLMQRLKHFNADLTGWEEKNKTVDFPLVAIEKGAVHFDGMSFYPQGDSLTIYLAIEQKDGKVSEQRFLYVRVRGAPEAGVR